MSAVEPPADHAWSRALEDAAGAQTLEDALAAVLASLAPWTGAVAAGFVEGSPLRAPATWRCMDGEVLARAPELFAADSAAEADRARLVPAERVGSFRDEPSGPALVVPVTGTATPAALLLFYRPGHEPSGSQRTSALGLAALARLLIERDALAEEAHQAREARNHFLVAIHHELWTPATAIVLEAGLLQSGLVGELPERLKSSLGRLEGQVNELVRVVRRVLDLAHLEASAEPPRDDLVDPRRTVIEIARRVEPSAQRKGITLSLFLPRSLPMLQTDLERFRRILLYLLANALKYTDQGRVQVRVERTSHRAPGQRREQLLIVRVVDTGRGIPPDEWERIFEPFTQVEEGARTDSLHRGVGLGLPLARRLAQSLGGDVTVESTPGEGTTATFSLPYRQPRPG